MEMLEEKRYQKIMVKKSTKLEFFIYWTHSKIQNVPLMVILLLSPFWFLVVLYLMDDKEFNDFITKLDAWVKII